MNLAIGDAFNLGRKLALVANRQAHERLLDSYLDLHRRFFCEPPHPAA